MLILHAKNIIKYYGDRLILNVPDFKIYTGDRIGLIGTNGCGKSTLLNILSGKCKSETGFVNISSTYSYITQLEIEETNSYKSGGEVTKAKIFEAILEKPGLLFADEPTANLDTNAILKTELIFKNIKGALLIVSHDRRFLDELCNKIIKLENGILKEYIGNYSDYEKQSKAERERAQKEYQKYIANRKHLQSSVSGVAKAERSIKKTPSRMGNSEARLHKRSSTEIKKHLAKQRKGIQTRLDKLQEKEKPPHLTMPKIYHQGVSLPVSSSTLTLNLKVLKAGDKELIEEMTLVIPTGSKIALTGSNGSGKTTLLKKIWYGGPGVKVAPGCRMSYFNQKLNNIDQSLSLLENITKDSTLDQGLIRTVLASILFNSNDIEKKASVLSGGEKVKLQLVKVILSGADFLILDEVTNFLDIQAIKAIENLIRDFPGTVIFVSHDRSLINKVADRVYEIVGNRLIDATYRNQVSDPIDTEVVKTNLKLAEISSLLCRQDISDKERERLVMEYNRLAELKKTSL